MAILTKPFKRSYVMIPIVIGLSVVGWLFWREFNPQLFSDIRFSWRIITYYLYLIIGACIIPSWLKKFNIKSN